ncbi:MAG: GMC family oxidoreductase N-terminal domain-containing protein [Burkholderiaceae bacterium]
MIRDEAARLPNGQKAVGGRSVSWISNPFVELAAQLTGDPSTPPVDVLVVGSGYGGAIAAAAFSSARKPDGEAPDVVVLERGHEYLRGAFPSAANELAGQVRFGPLPDGSVRGQNDGLFDIKLGADVSCLVANGLGGGSLINAGVMLAPDASVWEMPCWPGPVAEWGRAREDCDRAYAHVARLLGARTESGEPNTIERARMSLPGKYRMLRALHEQGGDAGTAVEHFDAAPITVGMVAGDRTAAGVELAPCNGCGDCATGCNFGAKNSLDLNLLASARAAGARIYTGAIVERIERDPDGVWQVHAMHTDPHLRERQGGPILVRARHVVLAAGTYGSTAILLRSQRHGLALSPRLGSRFSGNGDTIAAVVPRTVNAAARHVAQAGGADPGLPLARPAGDEGVAPARRGIGPTITGVIDRRSDPSQPAMVIEEFGIPATLRRMLDEVITTGRLLQQLGEPLAPADRAAASVRDPAAVDPATIDATLIVGMMGDDGAGGVLELAGDPRRPAADAHELSEPAVRVRWPQVGRLPLFEHQMTVLRDHVAGLGADWMAVPNPAWRPFDPRVASMLGEIGGPVLSVHPLGGCPMGEDRESGVVDHAGRVFVGGLRPAGTESGVQSGPDSGTTGETVHRGLVVLDGSIMPGALAVNPALTIATLAHRATTVLAKDWGYTLDESWGTGLPAQVHADRPPFQAVDPDRVPPRAPTVLQVCERLTGELSLDRDDGGEYVAELTLTYAPTALLDPGVADGRRVAAIDRTSKDASEPGSYLRLYRRIAWEAVFRPREDVNLASGVAAHPDTEALAGLRAHYQTLFERYGDEHARDWLAAHKARVTGELEFLVPVATEHPRFAALCSAGHWFLHRGMRDIWQWVANARRQAAMPSAQASPGTRLVSAIRGFVDRFAMFRALAGRVSEDRRFEYRLEASSLPLPQWKRVTDSARIPPPSPAVAGLVAPLELSWRDAPFGGAKTIGYRRISNPWRQLMEMSVDRFPAPLARRSSRRLSVDLGFFAQAGLPLLRIASQQSLPDAIFDLARLGLFSARALLVPNVWNLRTPDAVRGARGPKRLPGAIAGLPEPDVHLLRTGTLPDGSDEPAYCRLTRYRAVGPQDAARATGRGAAHRPIVMMHGYSASGTTFTHAAIECPLAAQFARAGRDVWVLDYRSSAGMPTGAVPWSFEDVAYNDIPLAFAFIAEQTGQPPVDVFAHCMSAAMLSMAVMAAPKAPTRFPVALRELGGRVGTVVLSQVGAAMQFSPANVFRAYLMNYLRLILMPVDRYEFRPEAGAARPSSRWSTDCWRRCPIRTATWNSRTRRGLGDASSMASVTAWTRSTVAPSRCTTCPGRCSITSTTCSVR